MKYKYLLAFLITLNSGMALADKKQAEDQTTLPAFAGAGDTGDENLNQRFKRTMKLTLNIFTPKKIFIDYSANEVKADLQYRDKLFVIKGKISKISKDFTDGVYLEFNNPSNQFEGVNANLYQTQICGSISKAKVCDVTALTANLKKNDIVLLDCYGSGMTMGRPMLKDCLVRLPAENIKK